MGNKPDKSLKLQNDEAKAETKDSQHEVKQDDDKQKEDFEQTNTENANSTATKDQDVEDLKNDHDDDDKMANLKAKLSKNASLITDEEWKTLLSSEEYSVLRDRETETPFTGKYDRHFVKQGYYACNACKNALYSWESKYNSGCGWPAFNQCFKNSVLLRFEENKTSKHNVYQIEIVCANCQSHLGHALLNTNAIDLSIAKQNINDNHYQCVNSLSICYIDDSKKVEQLESEKLDLTLYASVFR